MRENQIAKTVENDMDTWVVEGFIGSGYDENDLGVSNK